jgi:hypothetical protein
LNNNGLDEKPGGAGPAGSGFLPGRPGKNFPVERAWERFR